MTRTSLAGAIEEVQTRDPVLAHLVMLAGPIRHRSLNPDGPFGALVRSIVFQQLAGIELRDRAHLPDRRPDAEQSDDGGVGTGFRCLQLAVVSEEALLEHAEPRREHREQE